MINNKVLGDILVLKPAEVISNVDEIRATIERKKLFWAQRKQLANPDVCDPNNLNLVRHQLEFNGKYHFNLLTKFYLLSDLRITREERKADEAFPGLLLPRRFRPAEHDGAPYVNPADLSVRFLEAREIANESPVRETVREQVVRNVQTIKNVRGRVCTL